VENWNDGARRSVSKASISCNNKRQWKSGRGDHATVLEGSFRLRALRPEMRKMTLIVEPSLDEMLAEPIVRLMMAADRVEPSRVYSLVRRVKRRPLRSPAESRCQIREPTQR
jgi:hypothetical protein